jgi:molybdenum cofactor guanylyltransferase
MSDLNSICFGLLAGGRSSRMGADKAALLWHGVPAWKHQLRLATEIGAKEILVSGKADGPYRDSAKVVVDEFSERGPIGGLAALLGAMKSDWLVVTAVDMPLLDAETLRRVLALRENERGVVLEVNGRTQPFAAVFPRTVVTLARQHLSAADRSLRAFVAGANQAGLVRVVTWNDSEVFRSLNTPNEWAIAQRAT